MAAMSCGAVDGATEKKRLTVQCSRCCGRAFELLDAAKLDTSKAQLCEEEMSWELQPNRDELGKQHDCAAEVTSYRTDAFTIPPCSLFFSLSLGTGSLGQLAVM